MRPRIWIDYERKPAYFDLADEQNRALVSDEYWGDTME